MSAFIESVDDMVSRHFADDALRELGNAGCSFKDYTRAEEIIRQLIRGSIVHARSQVQGRRTGTMTFNEAMQLVRDDEGIMVTRPSWGVLRAIRCCQIYADDDSSDEFLGDWTLDNTEGGISGDGFPYKPTVEDQAASDWMLYQEPEENWIDIDFQ